MFSDLPRPHQREMIRLAFVAVLSSTYFITLAVLAQPIRSRSFVTQVTVPSVPVVRTALIDPPAVVPVHVRAPRPLRARTLQPLAGVQLASFRESPTVGAMHAVYLAPQPERRPNVFTRFFHGVFRGGQPVPVKSDVP